MCFYTERMHTCTHISQSQTRLSTHTHTKVRGIEAISSICYLSPVVLQSLSHVWLSTTPRTAACQASPTLTISWSLLTFLSNKLVMHPMISSFVTLLSGFVLMPLRAIISLKYHKGITNHRSEKSGSKDNTWPKSAVIVASQLIFPKIHVTSPEFHCFAPYSHYAREIIPNFSVSSYVSWCKLDKYRLSSKLMALLLLA